jgi:hypothetical protein
MSRNRNSEVAVEAPLISPPRDVTRGIALVTYRRKFDRCVRRNNRTIVAYLAERVVGVRA